MVLHSGLAVIDPTTVLEMNPRMVSDEQLQRFELIRLVRLFARRFTLCTQMRGVREGAPLTRTTTWRGDYETSAELRSEFFVTCGLPRRARRGMC